MKEVRLLVGLLLVGLAAGCLEKPNSTPGTASTILYRHHFLGTNQLAHNTNLASIPAVLALPATRDLAEQVFQKLSRSPEQLWRKALPANAATPPGLARPLLEDLASAESYAEVRGPLQSTESVLAIELNDERAALWRTNLGAILTGWQLGTPTGDAAGWEIKRPDAPKLIKFVRAGKWVFVGAGQDGLTLLPNLVEKVRKEQRPVAAQPDVPLELDADLPRLGDWLPPLRDASLPPVHLSIAGKGNYLRTELQLNYESSLGLKLDPWRILTNKVNDPIISFTVARGLAPLLRHIKEISALGLTQMPNQFCAWGPGSIHVNIVGSAPMEDPTNFLHQLGPKLPDLSSNMLGQSIGGFSLISNRNELVWYGLPVLIPDVRPVQDAETGFLLGELLPVSRSTNPGPAELFSQLNDKPNLVYYDWELSPRRLIHARQLLQLWDMLHSWRFPSTNAPAQRWLDAVAPHLGNTITEANMTSGKELAIVRKSDLGFTGFELALLMRWVESKGFPWTFEPPPPTASRQRGPRGKTNPPPANRLPPNIK